MVVQWGCFNAHQLILLKTGEKLIISYFMASVLKANSVWVAKQHLKYLSVVFRTMRFCFKSPVLDVFASLVFASLPHNMQVGEGGETQHQGLGTQLLAKAEQIALTHGYLKVQDARAP